MILRPQLEPTDHQSVLDYYIEHYAEVHIVSCNECGTDLAIEIRGEVSGYKLNDYGFTVLPFGDSLLSSRVRLDGSMGYQCGAKLPNPAFPAAKKATERIHKDQLEQYDKGYEEAVRQATKAKADKPEYNPPIMPRIYEPETIMCLNDTRATPLEEQLSPDGTFLPHEVHAIHQRQVQVGWKPKVKIRDNKEIHETFTRERVK